MLLHVSVVNTLVIPQTVQGTVDTLADVAHGLLRGSHVHVLDVSLKSGQRRQVLVARVAAEVLAAHSAGTWPTRAIVVIVVVPTNATASSRAHISRRRGHSRGLQTAQG